MDDMHERFNSTLANIMNNKKANSVFMTKERYEDLLKKVNESKIKVSGKKPEDYQRLKRYDIMKVGDVEKLIFPVSKSSSNVRFYVYFEQLFSIIHETHLSIGHGGRNRMIKELQKKYKNITAEEVMIYLNLCTSCPKKCKLLKKEFVRPILQELSTTCQANLIDMQSQPDNDFKFILIYQYHLTKFVQLRALKDIEDVAFNLIDIFTIFGAPNVLQSDDQFINQIVQVCAMWPDLKIVSQTQGLADPAIQDIENMLSSWLKSNQTSKWSEGLRFVQLMKNREFHGGINCTPYEAMFGTSVKATLNRSSFPNESIDHVKIEENVQAESIYSEMEDDSDMDNNEMSQNEDPPKVNWQEHETSIKIKKEPCPDNDPDGVIHALTPVCDLKDEDVETFYTEPNCAIKVENSYETKNQNELSDPLSIDDHDPSLLQVNKPTTFNSTNRLMTDVEIEKIKFPGNMRRKDELIKYQGNKIKMLLRKTKRMAERIEKLEKIIETLKEE